MQKISLSICFLAVSACCYGQYFQFSQYNFTLQRINPATVSSSIYAALALDYRNQSTGGGLHLNSNHANVSYPFINRRGVRWSGIGLSVMDDRSGQTGLFSSQEVGVSYAVNIPISKLQTLGFGMKALYLTRKLDLDGLFTGSQYMPDRGFVESLSNGENLGVLRNDFFTFSAGLYWQQTDKKGNKLAYWGVSFFDFNKPDDSFLGSSSQLNSTAVGMIGWRLTTRNRVSFFPEVLFTRSGARNVVNGGLITSYEINSYRDKPSDKIDIITKYVPGRSGIIGLQLHRENFSIGFTYDFPVVVVNPANTGALEVGVELRRLVDPRQRILAKRKKQLNERGRSTKPAQAVDKQVKKTTLTAKDSVVAKASTPKKEDLSTRLRHKQDSIHANGTAGIIEHEPLVLEKATLHFNFRFNSVDLDEEASAYLDDLVKALQDNSELKLKLVGHTDNIGTDKFNLKLSIKRAEAIKFYLVAKGIDENRIVAEGVGMREPLNNNANDAERAMNRRVEMTILYSD